MKYFLHNYSFSLKTTALSLLVFTFFRIILLFHHLDALAEVPFSVILKGLLMGSRFDLVITCYFMSLPLIIESISQYVSNQAHFVMRRFVLAYLYIIYAPTLFVSTADIPFFNHFYARFNIMAFQWMDTPSFVIQMIFKDPNNYLYLLMFVVVYVSFILILNKISKSSSLKKQKSLSLYYIICTVLLLGLCFLGIRGRTSIKSPIKTGTAFFSTYPIVNHSSLNPLFTLGRSVIEKNKNKDINFIDKDVAIEYLKSFYNIENNNIVNEFEGSNDSIQPNIILILAESMSAGLLEYNDKNQKLTPFLNKLIKDSNSIYFSNTYSAGIHTYSGVYASIFGFPTLYKIHPMNQTVIKTYKYSIPFILKEKGYENLYFTTHDEQFDNIAGFLMNNGFDKIISQKDYPAKQVLSNLGVPDHYMFDYAINNLNKLTKPFFAVLLTASNHKPYVIPKNIDFVPLTKDINKDIISYSDWALKYFIEKAKKQKWYNNCIFVIVADHGMLLKNKNYDICLNYNHIPLVFYSPKYISKNKIEPKIASQIDISNTILGFMKVKWKTNNLGKNLFLQNRQYATFIQNDYIASIDTNNLWYYNVEIEKENLFNLHSIENNNLINIEKDKANKMRKYSLSFFQLAKEVK